MTHSSGSQGSGAAARAVLKRSRCLPQGWKLLRSRWPHLSAVGEDGRVRHHAHGRAHGLRHQEQRCQCQSVADHWQRGPQHRRQDDCEHEERAVQAHAVGDRSDGEPDGRRQPGPQGKHHAQLGAGQAGAGQEHGQEGEEEGASHAAQQEPGLQCASVPLLWPLAYSLHRCMESIGDPPVHTEDPAATHTCPSRC